MFKPNTFYSVLNPMFYLCKIIGLAPFTLGNENYKNSIPNVIWSFSVMIFIFVTTTISLSNRPPLHGYGLITKLTETLDTYCSQIGMCCGILFESIFVNNILISIQSIEKFDEHIKQELHFNIKQEYRKGKAYLIIVLLIILIFIAFSASFAIKSTVNIYSFEFMGELILYAGPLVISSFVSFQFCVIVLSLKRRFKWLNKIISGIATNFEKDFFQNNNLFPSVMHIRPTTHIVTAGLLQDKALNVFEEIREKHYELCTICRNTNKCYSFQILLIILQNFMTIILALFFCGKHVLETNNVLVGYILYASNQMVIAVLQIIALVFTCSATVAEAQKAAFLIHKAISIQNQCKEELELEVSFFSLQLLHQNVEFTACGIFAINESLLLSIAGAVTTYLVIVIQFEL